MPEFWQSLLEAITFATDCNTSFDASKL